MGDLQEMNIEKESYKARKSVQVSGHTHFEHILFKDMNLKL